MSLHINATSACLPGLTYTAAVSKIVAGISEPAWGMLATTHCQLCPQNHGTLSENAIASLVQNYPDVQFRLHANVRVEKAGHPKWDASCFNADTITYFEEMALLSRQLKAPAYTLHAGLRANANLINLKNTALALEDMFECPVGIEGMYPAKDNIYLVSGWEEYKWFLENQVKYALDLSHLAILAKRTRSWDTVLVSDMLTSPLCLEIHVSDNDGRADTHSTMSRSPEWLTMLEDSSDNITATIFSEGNQLKGIPMQDRRTLYSA